jgi:hypothetical protein
VRGAAPPAGIGSHIGRGSLSHQDQTGEMIISPVQVPPSHRADGPGAAAEMAFSPGRGR